MTKIWTSLLAIAASFTAFSQPVSITQPAVAYTQNFNTLANSGTSGIMPQGWLFEETGTNANSTYAADNGVANQGNTYSFGTGLEADRALGGIQSGSLNPYIGVAYVNNTGTTITSLAISYTGEMWRAGVTNRGTADRLDFQYSLDATSLLTGSWVDVDALDFGSPNTSTSLGSKDGNASEFRRDISFTLTNLNIPNGVVFYLRFTDFNITGADDALAIDDFSISANGGGLSPCAAPVAQPTGLLFSQVTSSSINGSFTASISGATEYLVVYSTQSNLGASPANGTDYSEGDALGSGTVAYRGPGTSFSLTALQASTTYYVFVFAANNSACSGGPAYLGTSPLNGSTATQALPACMAPGAAPSALQLFAGSTSINGSYTEAAGADGYLVVVSSNANLAFSPVNGNTYTVGQTVGNGRVVKYGAGSTFTAAGLTASTLYYFSVFSVSQFACTGGPLYLATPLTGQQSTTAAGTGIPAGYYDNAAGKTCAELKTALSTIITNGMQPKSYASLFTQYLTSDIKPREVGNGSTNVIWDIYSDVPGPANDPYNFTPGTAQCGNYSVEGDCYNREHSVPQSWFGASANSGSAGPESDFHHIFPTDGKVNGYRGNFIFGEVASARITSLNGSKVGSSAIAGFSGDVFEPIDAYKGDLARAFLYFVTRYENNMTTWGSSGTGQQAFDPSTFPSVDVPYLRLMLQWHTEDPVSQKEIDRNNSGYAYQGNRNPFVDVPDYANLVWNSSCSGLGALPVNLISFGGRLQGSAIALQWKVAQEQQLRGYTVERSNNGRQWTAIGEVKAKGLSQYTFSDDVTSLQGTRVYYRLVMTDLDGKTRLSEIFSLHLPRQLMFTAVPNPARQQLTLQLGSSFRSGQVRITDYSGRIVLQQSLTTGTQQVQLRLGQLASGTYLVTVQNQQGQQATQRIQVVQ